MIEFLSPQQNEAATLEARQTLSPLADVLAWIALSHYC